MTHTASTNMNISLHVSTIIVIIGLPLIAYGLLGFYAGYADARREALGIKKTLVGEKIHTVVHCLLVWSVIPAAIACLVRWLS